jgi:predicted metal-dependent enzyme (double-stranded beta helix superfamily)
MFEQIAGPAAASVPDLAAIGAALVELARDTDYLAAWVSRLDGDCQALPVHVPERGPRLMAVHRREGQMGAIHDHATWVAISPIIGLETHR